MVWTHGGGERLTYEQRRLYRAARERSARRAAARDRLMAHGVRAAMLLGAVGLVLGVAVMLGCLGGCAASPRPARTSVTPGTAESSVTTTENRGSSMTVRAVPVRELEPQRGAGTLRIRLEGTGTKPE